MNKITWIRFLLRTGLIELFYYDYFAKKQQERFTINVINDILSYNFKQREIILNKITNKVRETTEKQLLCKLEEERTKEYQAVSSREELLQRLQQINPLRVMN